MEENNGSAPVEADCANVGVDLSALSGNPRRSQKRRAIGSSTLTGGSGELEHLRNMALHQGGPSGRESPGAGASSWATWHGTGALTATDLVEDDAQGGMCQPAGEFDAQGDLDLGLDTSAEEMQAASYPEGERGQSAMSDNGSDKAYQLHRPCSTCRAARVLCDRGHPCGRCLRIGFEATCQAPPTVKRGRPPKDVQQARLEMLAADLLSTGLPPSERVQPKGTAAPAGAGKSKAGKAAPTVVTVSTASQTSPEMSPVMSGIASSSAPTACALGAALSTHSSAAAASAAAPKDGQSVNIWLREVPPDPYTEQKIEALRQQLRSIGLEPCV